LREAMRVAESCDVHSVQGDALGEALQRGGGAGPPLLRKGQVLHRERSGRDGGRRPQPCHGYLSYGPDAAEETVEESREVSVEEAEEAGFVCLEFRNDDF
jgi:hypothetical protein